MDGMEVKKDQLDIDIIQFCANAPKSAKLSSMYTYLAEHGDHITLYRLLF